MKRVSLDGAWVDEESRGIPVLPGEYPVEFQYKSERFQSSVKVIADPRFNIISTVDESLYKYQTRVRAQVKRMNALLNTLQNYKGKIK